MVWDCIAVWAHVPRSIKDFWGTKSALCHSSSGVTTGGGGRGQSAPTGKFLTGKFLLTYREMRGKEKKGKWRRKEGKSKKGRWKIKNRRRKSYKMRRGPFCLFVCVCLFVCLLFFFFFFLLFTFKTTDFFGYTKMGMFHREKSISRREKNQKKWLCPLWKIFLLRPCTQASQYKEAFTNQLTELILGSDFLIETYYTRALMRVMWHKSTPGQCGLVASYLWQKTFIAMYDIFSSTKGSCQMSAFSKMIESCSKIQIKSLTVGVCVCVCGNQTFW